MKQEMLLSILLGVLIVVSALQAYQLVNLKDAVSSGTVTASSAQAQYGGSGAQSGSSAIPSALDSAPNMVGGC